MKVSPSAVNTMTLESIPYASPGSLLIGVEHAEASATW